MERFSEGLGFTGIQRSKINSRSSPKLINKIIIYDKINLTSLGAFGLISGIPIPISEKY